MATPFRRPWVSWRLVSSIGELRGCTLSAGSQDAGQAIATIPRSSGDGPVEIQRRAISLSSMKEKENESLKNENASASVTLREGDH